MDRLLLRSIPRPSQSSVFVGDVVAFHTPSPLTQEEKVAPLGRASAHPPPPPGGGPCHAHIDTFFIHLCAHVWTRVCTCTPAMSPSSHAEGVSSCTIYRWCQSASICNPTRWIARGRLLSTTCVQLRHLQLLRQQIAESAPVCPPQSVLVRRVSAGAGDEMISDDPDVRLPAAFSSPRPLEIRTCMPFLHAQNACEAALLARY